MELCLGRLVLMVVVAVAMLVEGKAYTPSPKTVSLSALPTQVAARGPCALGREVVVSGEDKRAVMVVLVVGGLGAGAARRSCHAHGATPFFLNTQEDADILRRTLKDCVKTEKLGSVWVPSRRHASHKGVELPADGAGGPARGNLEYDWMSAHYNRTLDTIMLFPFPPKNTLRRRGIICERKDDE